MARVNAGAGNPTLDDKYSVFSLLLGNDEIKRQVLVIFTDEIYQSLRNA